MKIIPAITRLLLIFMISVAESKNIPQRPIIGIYTQQHKKNKSTYIAASYVKFIQMSGAQVVPIFSYSKKSDILELMTKINGVVFPGGGARIDINNRWTKNADAILKYAIQQNNKGNVFPIYGVCLGQHLLAILTASYNRKVRTKVSNKHYVQPIKFVNKGYLFEPMRDFIIQKLQTGSGLYYFTHNWAETMDTYENNQYLNEFWQVIATGQSVTGFEFIAAMQAKKYPFYTVQFHPQKNLFQWKVDANRTYQGIQAAQIISNRFVEQARKNKNSFDNKKQLKQLSIYNYKPQSTKMKFTEIYVFKQTFTQNLDQQDEQIQQDQQEQQKQQLQQQVFSKGQQEQVDQEQQLNQENQDQREEKQQQYEQQQGYQQQQGQQQQQAEESQQQ